MNSRPTSLPSKKSLFHSLAVMTLDHRLSRLAETTSIISLNHILRVGLLIAKVRLELKKVGKTTRPFRYDLNQIPYDYTVEVRNRFKGLDLTDRVPDELWMEVHAIVEETGIKTIPMEKKCKKAKWLSGEALQIAVSEKRSRKGKI